MINVSVEKKGFRPYVKHGPCGSQIIMFFFCITAENFGLFVSLGFLLHNNLLQASGGDLII